MDEAEIDILETLLMQTASLPLVAEMLGVSRPTALVAILRAGIREIENPYLALYPLQQIIELSRTYKPGRVARPRRVVP